MARRAGSPNEQSGPAQARRPPPPAVTPTPAQRPRRPPPKTPGQEGARQEGPGQESGWAKKAAAKKGPANKAANKAAKKAPAGQTADAARNGHEGALPGPRNRRARQPRSAPAADPVSGPAVTPSPAPSRRTCPLVVGLRCCSRWRSCSSPGAGPTTTTSTHVIARRPPPADLVDEMVPEVRAAATCSSASTGCDADFRRSQSARPHASRTTRCSSRCCPNRARARVGRRRGRCTPRLVGDVIAELRGLDGAPWRATRARAALAAWRQSAGHQPA